jgi:hypothetical protein
MIVEGVKTTSDTDSVLRFTTQKHEAKSLFDQQQILPKHQFDEVSWPEIHATLHTLPKMFQLFAGKQVFGVAAVLANLSKQKEYAHLGDKCPSCSVCKETTAHLLVCRKAGRVRCLKNLIWQVIDWMTEVGTTPDLTDLMADFLLQQGDLKRKRMTHIPPHYSNFLYSQESIGWRRMMEGMISKELILLDQHDVLKPHSKISQDNWVRGLITKLLEATHCIWIYRNITIHDNVSSLVATKGKEQLLEEIERQIEQGGEGLAESEKWMLEIDPSHLEHLSGEKEAYWLIAIKTACSDYQLSRRT